MLGSQKKKTLQSVNKVKQNFALINATQNNKGIPYKNTLMNIENTKAQMRKGVLEYCILSILKDGEAYTSDILTRLKDAKLLVVEGTIYPLLTRLKNAELLSYRWEESTSGPPRKYYALTQEGILFLSELTTTWSNLQQAVSAVTNTTPKK